MLTAAAVQWVLVGHDEPVQPGWLFGGFVATALLVDPRKLWFGGALGVVEAAPLTVSLALAFLSLEPWAQESTRTLWWSTALLGAVLWFVSVHEHFESRAVRSRLTSVPDADRGRAQVLRLGVSVALWVLLLTVSGAVGIDRWRASLDAEELAPSSAELLEGLSQEFDRWDDLGVEDLYSASIDDTVVVVANRVDPQTREQLPPRRMYLREHVLEEWMELQGAWRLMPADGPVFVNTDLEDGEADGHVDLRRRTGDGVRWPPSETQILEVIVQLPGRIPRLLEPSTLWSDGYELTITPDQRVLDVVHDLKFYRSGSVPEYYYADGFDAIDAVRDARRCRVPPDLPDRAWLEQLARQITEGDSDLERARNLARYFRENGEWRLPPEWEGDYRRFLESSMIGVCSHFAQAAALLCRLAGLPARVAVGYTSDEELPAMGGTVFRGRHRHAWVEVLFREIGWVALEVTPPRAQSAPSGNATDEGQGAEEQAQGEQGAWARTWAFLRENVAWLALLGFATAAVVLMRWGGSKAGSAKAGAAASAVTRRRRLATRWLVRLERVVGSRAPRRNRAQTAAEYVRGLQRALPELHGELESFLDGYQRLRWSGRQAPATTRRLVQDLRGALDVIGARTRAAE